MQAHLHKAKLKVQSNATVSQKPHSLAPTTNTGALAPAVGTAEIGRNKPKSALETELPREFNISPGLASFSYMAADSFETRVMNQSLCRTKRARLALGQVTEGGEDWGR